MIKKMLTFILIIVLCIFVYGCSAPANNNSNVETIIDVTQYFRISPEKLVEMLGEPKEIEEINFDSSNGNTYPMTIYYYDDSEFLIIDNAVVRLNIYKEMQYNSERDIFKMLSITTTNNTKKTADTGVALRYSPVSDNVADLWITNISDKKFNNIKVTYDLRYFN